MLVDVVPCQLVEEWMRDFESYQNAVDVEDKEEYMSSLNRSLSLAMEEFYKYELKTLHLYFNFFTYEAKI